MKLIIFSTHMSKRKLDEKDGGPSQKKARDVSELARAERLKLYMDLTKMAAELKSLVEEGEQKMDMLKKKHAQVMAEIQSLEPHMIGERLFSFLFSGADQKEENKVVRIAICSSWVENVLEDPKFKFVDKQVFKDAIEYVYDVEEYSHRTQCLRLMEKSTDPENKELVYLSSLPFYKSLTIDSVTPVQANAMVVKRPEILNWIEDKRKENKDNKVTMNFWNLAVPTVVNSKKELAKIDVEIDFQDNDGVVGTGTRHEALFVLSNVPLKELSTL